MDYLFHFGNMKVADLKNELRKVGASVTGRKPVLVQRLVSIYMEKQKDVESRNKQSKRSNPNNSSLSQPKKQRMEPDVDVAGINELFEKYVEKGGEDNTQSDRMDLEGMLKFCEDLGVDPEDPVMIALSYEMNAHHMGVYTKSEFQTGCQKLKCSTMEGLKGSLDSLRELLAYDHPEYSKLYRFTFKWACEEGQRNITTETAIALWPMLIPKSSFALIDSWVNFVETKKERVKVVTKDTWNQLLEFISVVKTSGIEKYDAENDSWPVLIDEFVESSCTFLKSKLE